MRDAPALHLLFATNFSEACYRTASAVGQLAGRFPLTLTIGAVSCLLDFDDDPASFLRLVSAVSRRLAARLRVLAVIAPVDDGTLAEVLTSDAPLTPARAAERIQELCAGQELPSIDVALGERGREVRRMLGHNPTDLLFVGRRHAAGPRFLQRTLDRLPCPVVCVDSRQWPSHDGRSRTSRTRCGTRPSTTR